MSTTSRRLVGASVVVALAVTPCSAQQVTAPNLSRGQRAALQALVRAVDEGASALDVPDADWPVHLLRASDGSHYVAFSIHADTTIAAPTPVVLYVRLATKRDEGATSAERSAVAEWLAGQAPVPVLPRRGIAIGDMPTYGAAGILTRGCPSRISMCRRSSARTAVAHRSSGAA
jgi:hypothetical protein